MAIPGLKAQFDVRAKVRIGEKKRTAGGKEYPAATDYFLCDDPEFVALYGDRPKALRVVLPFASPSDAFSTGLEMWRGEMLACYSKGETIPVNGKPQAVAYRKATIRSKGKDVDLLAGEVIVGEPMGRGKERTPIACAFRNCAFFKAKECRPLGRLQFFLEGGRTDAVLQIDTKSWNSIEKIEATLGAAAAKGDLRGRVFDLTVHIEQSGNQKYPLLSLTEADVIVNSEQDFATAVELLELRVAVDQHGENPNLLRPALASALDLTNPGWREQANLVAKLREVGPLKAAQGILGKYEL